MDFHKTAALGDFPQNWWRKAKKEEKRVRKKKRKKVLQMMSALEPPSDGNGKLREVASGLLNKSTQESAGAR